MVLTCLAVLAIPGASGHTTARLDDDFAYEPPHSIPRHALLGKSIGQIGAMTWDQWQTLVEAARKKHPRDEEWLWTLHPNIVYGFCLAQEIRRLEQSHPGPKSTALKKLDPLMVRFGSAWAKLEDTLSGGNHWTPKRAIMWSEVESAISDALESRPPPKLTDDLVAQVGNRLLYYQMTQKNLTGSLTDLPVDLNEVHRMANICSNAWHAIQSELKPLDANSRSHIYNFIGNLVLDSYN